MIDVSTDARAHLCICGTCYALYETERPDGMNQPCRCTPRDEPRWPGHDFNEHALLCLCCGLEVVSSGSRWSSYVCRECQLLAMGVSLWERRLVFPIGRHSMMHTWVPDTRARSRRPSTTPPRWSPGAAPGCMSGRRASCPAACSISGCRAGRC